MTRQRQTMALLLALVLLGAAVVGAHAAQKLVAGQLAGGGGGGAGGGLKLVGSIPASPAGRSSGGGFRLVGGFAGAAQTWSDSFAASDAVANVPSGMVTSLAAAGTARGAQITFGLSAPATVQVRVLNIAGRPIGTVTSGQDCAAGLTTLVWSGLSDAGLQAPNGLYLVEVNARADAGSQSRALTTIRLQRYGD